MTASRRTYESALSPDPFRRLDESSDATIAALTALYRELIPRRARILDLMSSWVSHLPADVEYVRVTGLGMNAEELGRNPRLTERVVQDLNLRPALPWSHPDVVWENSTDGSRAHRGLDAVAAYLRLHREVPFSS